METCQDTELVERFGVLPLLQLIYFTVNDLTGTHHSLDTGVTLTPEVEIVVKAYGVETCEGVLTFVLQFSHFLSVLTFLLSLMLLVIIC